VAEQLVYRLRLSRQVRAEIDTLPGHIRQRLRRVIAQLAEDPRPAEAKALSGDLTGYYRLRIDLYRVIYTIDDDAVVVEVIRVTRRTPRTYEGLT